MKPKTHLNGSRETLAERIARFEKELNKASSGFQQKKIDNPVDGFKLFSQNLLDRRN